MLYFHDIIEVRIFRKTAHIRVNAVSANVEQVRACAYSVIQKDGLNFVRLYFLNYTWYVNDLLA